MIMETRLRPRSWLSIAIFFFLSLSARVQALYFHMDNDKPTCFFEELPKDTLVVGTRILPQSLHEQPH